MSNREPSGKKFSLPLALALGLTIVTFALFQNFSPTQQTQKVNPGTQILPQWIGAPVSGGGGNTWDGRLYVKAGFLNGAPNLYAQVFRPEVLDQSQGPLTPVTPQLGIPNLIGNGAPSSTFYDFITSLSAINQYNVDVGAALKPSGTAFSWATWFTLGFTPTPGAELGLNELTIVKDANHLVNPVIAGTTATYYLILFSQTTNPVTDCFEPNSTTFGLGAMTATVVISNPNTVQATVLSAVVNNQWQRMTLKTPLQVGSQTMYNVCARNISGTLDGHLVVLEDASSVSYIWNANPSTQPNWYLTGWSQPQDITKMHFNEKNSVVDGVSFYNKYPVAKMPMVDSSGRSYRDSNGHPLWLDGSQMMNPNPPTGIPNPDRHLYQGAYPWITPDGTDIMSPTTNPWEPGGLTGHLNPDSTNPSQDADFPVRSGVATIGLHTNFSQRNMDGPINENRGLQPLLNQVRSAIIQQYLQAAGVGSISQLPQGTYTLLGLQTAINNSVLRYLRQPISSPGPLPSMWGPYRDIARFEIPYQKAHFIIPVLESHGQYDELNFDDSNDGNYLLFMHMQEGLERTIGLAPKGQSPAVYAADESLIDAEAQLSKGLVIARNQQSYQTSITPDSSGHAATFGKLSGGAAFPFEYNQIDQSVGAVGQAIFFPEAGAITLVNDKQLESFAPGENLTLEFFLKRLLPVAANRQLIKKPGIFEVALNKQGKLSFAVDVTLNGALSRATLEAQPAALSASAGCTASRPCAIEALPWIHVAMTFCASTGMMEVFVDGVLASRKITAPGGTIGFCTKGPMVIGPNFHGAPVLPPNQAYVLLDEVSVSNVVRTISEVQTSAYFRPQVLPVATFPGGALPLGLNAADLGPQPDDGISPARIALGAAIFNDPVFSSNGKISCATCHQSTLGFTDGRALAFGLQVGKRNTPTIFNRAFGSLQFLDGRASTVESQASFPFVNPTEMGLASMSAVLALINPDRVPPGATQTYRELFRAAGYSMRNESQFLNAVGAFVRTTVGANSRVDQFLGGNASALMASEQSGLELFRGKARCITCHSNSNYSDEKFHRTGVALDAQGANPDPGRMAVTGEANDYGAFKTPTLRNVSKTAPYMHDGSLADLPSVVSSYNGGSVGVAQVDALIFPLGLTSQEMSDLVAFLMALDNQ